MVKEWIYTTGFLCSYVLAYPMMKILDVIARMFNEHYLIRSFHLYVLVANIWWGLIFGGFIPIWTVIVFISWGFVFIMNTYFFPDLSGG